jgi:carboxylesterase type B
MIQYRLGAFGFLSSEDVHKYGQTNAGLLDMRFALEWIQKHIDKFGGDASRVTIGGESSGAGSGILQAMAYGGREDHLFNNVSGLNLLNIWDTVADLHRLLPLARIRRQCTSTMTKYRQIIIISLQHMQGATRAAICPSRLYSTALLMQTPIHCNMLVQMSPFREHGVLGPSNL